MKKKRPFMGEVALYACGVCAMEMLYPQPGDEALFSEYEDYFSRREQFSRDRFPKERFFRELLIENADLIRPSRREISALELGAGGGDFVRAFNSVFAGVPITAVERNPASSERFEALDCIYVSSAVEEFLSVNEMRYDMIFLFDLLEHLRDPAGTLCSIASITRSGGRVVLTAPATDSAIKAVLGRLWPQYKLEHIFYFSTGSLGRLGEMAGLDELGIMRLAKRLPVSYLLSVGANFGPLPLRVLARVASKLVPAALYDWNIRLRFGEALAVYEKK